MGVDRSLRKNKSFIDRVGIGRGRSIDLMRSKPEPKQLDFVSGPLEKGHKHGSSAFLENNYGHYNSFQTKGNAHHSSSLSHYVKPENRGRSANYMKNNFKYSSINREPSTGYHKDNSATLAEFKNDLIRSGLYQHSTGQSEPSNHRKFIH